MMMAGLGPHSGQTVSGPAEADAPPPSGQTVRHYRQILLWPLQLMPLSGDQQIQNHCVGLEKCTEDNPWREVADEFGCNPEEFQERHYSEFVTFLPYVQRMLYGEGKGSGRTAIESPIRVFRRRDVSKVRLTYPGDPRPVTLNVAHVDLYFFYDLDVAILAVEVSTDHLTFERAHETLFRFGRAYPTFWDRDGHAGHCLSRVEWLGADGGVLATSDYERRGKYLAAVARQRAAYISAHWEWLMQPLVFHHSDQKGGLRYRLVEYHRMPVCGYLTLEEPRVLTRNDFMRLALVLPPGPSEAQPLPDAVAHDFEERYCHDRYWNDRPDGAAGTRFMCSGEAFVMVGKASEHENVTSGAGMTEQFRHQYFLVFLLCHLHKAALYMMSDRLLHALNRMDVGDADSVREFKRNIRQIKEIFLRFTHRYWFHEVSDQVMAKSLYRSCHELIGTDRLYDEVRDEVEEMNTYLDSDSLRRQANMVIRLTVVTIFGLIGTVATGFLGMNLIAAADEPMYLRIFYFLAVFVPTTLLTFYTITKSKRLADFLDALSDERKSMRDTFATLLSVWRGPPDEGED
jgi:hypothetical protein